MTLLYPWFWHQRQISYGRKFTRIGSFYYAVNFKITPRNLMLGFGTIYKAALLICIMDLMISSFLSNFIDFMHLTKHCLNSASDLFFAPPKKKGV